MVGSPEGVRRPVRRLAIGDAGSERQCGPSAVHRRDAAVSGMLSVSVCKQLRRLSGLV